MTVKSKGTAPERNQSQRAEVEQQVARFVCKETGINEEQALGLIKQLGMNVDTLLRKARNINRRKN